MSFKSYCLLGVSLLGSVVHGAATTPSAPTVNTVNGTYYGVNIPSFKQDAFLGIPYAQPPVGDLRFRRPQTYTQSWHGQRNATVRSDSCPGYQPGTALTGGGLTDGLTMGEDCLTMDIVRPANAKITDELPSFVWLYGGGFMAGGSADPKYNMSYIVQNSVDMGKPIIGIVINYRVMCFGFLGSQETLDAGVANLGLFDQRKALKWIQENIRAFGGDPTKVTIGGESAGGSSTGYHLVGFNGENEGLFRGAIMESASLFGASMNTPEQLQIQYQGFYNNLTAAVGCNQSTDSVACLRTAPFEKLYNACTAFRMTPVVDGEFITQLPSESIQKGEVADVAVIIGTNTDEGTAYFLGPRLDPLENDTDVANFLKNLGGAIVTELDSKAISTLMELYPDDPAEGCPFGTGPERFADQGYMFKRGAALAGDVQMHAGRRYYADWHAAHQKQPVYTYRFDQAPWNMQEIAIMIVPPVYVTHFSEVVYVFDNPNNNSNYIGPYEGDRNLQSFVSRSWVAFIHDLNPADHGLTNINLPTWPEYNAKNPQNIVFREGASWIEPDTYRKKQLEFWATMWPQLQN